MRGDEGDDREGHHAHARHRGRRRRRVRARRGRVGLSAARDEPVAFAGGALDRAAHLRTDPEWLTVALRDPAARAIVAGRDGVHPEPLPLQRGDDPIFLGLAPSGPVFAVQREGVPLTGLRDLAASLPADAAGLAAYAAAMTYWAHATRFCGVCGAPTEPREGGHHRVCANGHQHHPRTDPVVIMLVTRGDAVMLGRQPAWPAGRYSALAGFVEPGESLEAAVAREVREEAGVDVRAVRYVASQPWPFPASLMLGFQAEHAAGEPAPQDEELEDVRWFSRDEVAAAAGEDVAWLAGAGDGESRARLRLPPRMAIARSLIERWLAAARG